MASENETVEDIVAMLRRFAKGEELPTDEMPSFTSLADRIEAAHKREVAELRECVSDMRNWFRLYFSCSGHPNRAQCAGCRLSRCPYHRRRKALEGLNDGKKAD